MKLHQVKAFLAVMEKRSFSEAALELGLSQASVSHAVAELEKSLGVKLLERGRLGAQPTELAGLVAEQAVAMLQAEESIKQIVSLAEGQLKGCLRVATHPSLSSKVVPALFSHLKKTHKDLVLHLEVMTSNEALEKALRSNQADLALLLYESADDLFAWQLLEDEFVALVPKDFPLERNIIGLKELESFPSVLQQGRQCGEVIKQYLKNLDANVKPQAFLDEGAQVSMNEGQIMLDMVNQGLGMVMLASMLVPPLPEGVRQLPLEQPLYRQVFAAIHPSKLKMPAIRVALNGLKDLYPTSELTHLLVQPSQFAV